MRNQFRRISTKISNAAGTASAFVIALGIIVIWAATGPTFNFSDTWQLIINTGTTIVTFLMVFLIQNTQNRDSKAMHLKLDELIIKNKSADNSFVDLEDLSDSDFNVLSDEFKRLHGNLPDKPKSILRTLHSKIIAENDRRRTKKI